VYSRVLDYAVFTDVSVVRMLWIVTLKELAKLNFSSRQEITEC